MLSEYLDIIKGKKFFYLWTSQILSQITINIMNFLLLIRIFENTESTIATSFLWVCYALPAIIVGPLAAASVDLLNRRKILIITNLFQSLVIFFYALTHDASLFLLYGVVITYSLLNQFYVPAEISSLPSLVKKKDLAHANGLFFITQQTAIVVGFGIAGIMSSVFSFSGTLYICAGLLFLAFASVFQLPNMKTEEDIPSNFEKAFIKFFSSILDGYKYIKENSLILYPLLLLLIVQVCSVVVLINVPIIATEIFKIDPKLAGTLIAVPAGLGALIASLTLPRRLKQGMRKINGIKTSLMILTTSIFLISLLIPELGYYLRIIISSLLILLLGFSFVGILIPTQTFLQENIPGGLRGRVFGNYWFLVTIATLFPVIFSGTFTELFGSRIFLLLIAAITLSILLTINKFGDRFIRNGLKLNIKI